MFSVTWLAVVMLASRALGEKFNLVGARHHVGRMGTYASHSRCDDRPQYRCSDCADGDTYLRYIADRSAWLVTDQPNCHEEGRPFLFVVDAAPTPAAIESMWNELFDEWLPSKDVVVKHAHDRPVLRGTPTRSSSSSSNKYAPL